MNTQPSPSSACWEVSLLAPQVGTSPPAVSATSLLVLAPAQANRQKDKVGEGGRHSGDWYLPWPLKHNTRGTPYFPRTYLLRGKNVFLLLLLLQVLFPKFLRTFLRRQDTDPLHSLQPTPICTPTMAAEPSPFTGACSHCHFSLKGEVEQLSQGCWPV